MNKLPFKIKIISCIRNCEKDIEETLHQIKEFQSIFEFVEFYAAENDSIDNSLELLHKHSNSIKKQIYSFKNLDSKYPLRTHRLAFLQNTLLEKCRDADYIFVIDFDSILKNFDINGLLNTFERDLNSWDIVTANCDDRYYDIWTLRTEKLNYDCWDLINHKRQEGIIDDILIPMFIRANQVKIPKINKLIPVQSAFGGFGIYKTKSIQNCRYDGVLTRCECQHLTKNRLCSKEVCHHVTFHEQARLKNKAKIFINTDLIVNCQKEHLL